jgi:hypothetical protein
VHHSILSHLTSATGQKPRFRAARHPCVIVRSTPASGPSKGGPAGLLSAKSRREKVQQQVLHRRDGPMIRHHRPSSPRLCARLRGCTAHYITDLVTVCCCILDASLPRHCSFQFDIRQLAIAGVWQHHINLVGGILDHLNRETIWHVYTRFFQGERWISIARVQGVLVSVIYPPFYAASLIVHGRRGSHYPRSDEGNHHPFANSGYNHPCRILKYSRTAATVHAVQLGGCQLAIFARLFRIQDFSSRLAHDLLHSSQWGFPPHFVSPLFIRCRIATHGPIWPPVPR